MNCTDNRIGEVDLTLSLPGDPLERIFSFLDKESMVSACQVCKRWAPHIVRAARELRISMMVNGCLRFLKDITLPNISFRPQRVELVGIKERIKGAKTLKEIESKTKTQNDLTHVLISLGDEVLDELDGQSKAGYPFVERLFSLINLDKERALAEAIPDLMERLLTLLEIVRKFANIGEIASAREIANTMPKEFKAAAFSSIARALAKRGDINPACEIAKEIDHELYTPEILCTVAQKLAEIGDMKEAIEVAKSIPSKSYKAVALCEIAKKLSKIGDVDWALKVAHSIRHKLLKVMALCAIARNLAEMGRVNEAEAIAEAIPNAEYKERAFSWIAKASKRARLSS